MTWTDSIASSSLIQRLVVAVDDVTDPLPSLRSLSTLAISALVVPQKFLGNTRLTPKEHASASASCTSPELSCHNSSAVENLCCFNSPGGTLLLTQFWDAHPPAGPDDSWTIHGLWPDNCDGSYEAYCDDARNYRNITQILRDSTSGSATLDYMNTYWKDYQGNDEHFWEHEWGKHGTCISTLEPSCYTDYVPTQEVPEFFDRVVSLFKTLPTYEWLADAGITPSKTATYTSAQILQALSKHFDGHQVHIGCHGGALNEVWYFFNVRGSVQSGDFVSTEPIGTRSTCPSAGIRYLPKRDTHAPTSTASATTITETTTTATSTSTTSPGKSFVGRGSLGVVTSGNKHGCIISRGDWYTSGTCATFTAAKSGDTFTLKSSKGYCGIVDGRLECGNRVKTTAFESSEDRLIYNGTDTFYAESVPSGRRKSTVYIDSDYDVSLQIKWQG